MTKANWLHDIEVDEVSLVDLPANQHARVAIAKRAPEETVDYFNEQGEVVQVDDLEAGAVVYDDQGMAYLIEDEIDEADKQVDELVGAGVSKSFAEQVREDLSKALGDVERDEVIAKALGEVAKRDAKIAELETIAKAERTLRLQREYIAKAAEYDVPGVTPEELGPVMMRAAEALSHEDCQVLAKAFSSIGSVFDEIGTSGGAANHDVFGVVEDVLGDSEVASQVVAKSLEGNGDVHEAIEKAFSADPRAYDRYLAERRG